MNAYLPTNGMTLGTVGAAIAVIPAIGFGITQIRLAWCARCLAWMLVISAVLGVERITARDPPGFRMVAIIMGLLYAMKSVVSVECRATGKRPLTPGTWFLFAVGWFGMRPEVFEDVPGPTRRGSRHLVLLGVQRLVVGAALVALARFVWDMPDTVEAIRLRHVLATVLFLPGLSLILHFGLFNVAAGLWRHAGAKTSPLFRSPWASTSLSEFWGWRWNIAFAEMTATGVFRPLRRVVGPQAASATSFLFSGLLHELAISVPVKGGYGLPLLYFALHGLAVQIESILERHGHAIRDSKWLGRAWTAAWIVIPLPILFHPPFLEGCIWPLIGKSTHP